MSLRPLGEQGIVWATTGAFYPLSEVNGTTLAQKTRMMRLSRPKSHVIVSDIISSPTRVRVAHVRGINVLSADGSARWVDAGAIKRKGDGTPLVDPSAPCVKRLFPANA